MKEILDSVLFILFGSIALIMLSISIKIWICPSWKYNEAGKKRISGLAIDMKTNQWVGNKTTSEERALEILQ